LPPHAKGWQRFWKGIGIVMLLTGAALLIGALAGGRDPLQPLAGLRGTGNGGRSKKLPFEPVASVAELDAQSAGRRPAGDARFLCRLVRFVQGNGAFYLRRPGGAGQTGRFQAVEGRCHGQFADDKALLARFGLFGPPGILFFDKSGKEIKTVRVVGFQDAACLTDKPASIPQCFFPSPRYASITRGSAASS
jgi:thiol:disulfide interchange protein DsbD